LIVWGLLSYIGHIGVGLLIVTIEEFTGGVKRGIKEGLSDRNGTPPPPKPPIPVASGDTSFTVIKKNKNQEYVLSHKVYGNQIHMNSDDLYNPGDPCVIDMDNHKIAEIEIQRSSNKITKEKWLLPK